jgi:hypothetical protein
MSSTTEVTENIDESKYVDQRSSYSHAKAVKTRTTYLELSQDGAKFYLMCVIAHDLSHDITAQRMEKKLKETRNLNDAAAAVTSSAAAAAAETREDHDITNELNNDLKIAPQYDSIVNVGKAISIIEFQIAAAAPVAAAPAAAAPAAAAPALSPTKQAELDSNSGALIDSPLAVTIAGNVMSETSLSPSPESGEILPKLIANVAPPPAPARESRTVTRSMYRILQKTAGDVDDSKIMLIGKMTDIAPRSNGGSNPRRGSDKSNSNKTRKYSKRSLKAGFSPVSVTHDFDNEPVYNEEVKTGKLKFARPQTRKSKSARSKTRKLNSALLKERNRVFDEMLKSAFRQIIGETYQDPEYTRLNKYYIAMFDLYLSFTPNRLVSPLDIFNSSFIKEALILYSIYPDKPIKQLLNVVMQSKQTTDPELKGGGPNERTLLASIKGNTKFDMYRALYMNGPYPPENDLDRFLGSLKTDVDAILALPEYKVVGVKVRKNIIAGLQNTIAQNERALAQNQAKSGGGREKYKSSLKKTLITNFLKILFDGIYDACERAIKEDILAATYREKEINDSNRNLPQAKIANKPCKIVRTIVRGCFRYVFDSISPFPTSKQTDTYTIISPQNPDTSLYNSQKAMMINIANGLSQGGSTLDDNLMASIKAYVKEKDNMATFDTGLPFDGIGEHHIINNAATDQFRTLGLNADNVICPMSSILDAMTTFGSCSTGSGQDNEKHTSKSEPTIYPLYPTDIYISNGIEDNIVAYYGRSEQKITGTNKKGILQYGFRTPTYSLPLVIKTIDMTRPKVLDLSVSNTYDSIINRMVYIWNNSKINTDNLNVNQLFELLIQNEGTFTDMVSCSTVKSCGDVNQEINASFVNRGYDLLQYDKTEADKFKNTLIGIHKDRPAAARNVFLLSQKSDAINKNAYGGYASPSGFFFVGPKPPSGSGDPGGGAPAAGKGKK